MLAIDVDFHRRFDFWVRMATKFTAVQEKEDLQARWICGRCLGHGVPLGSYDRLMDQTKRRALAPEGFGAQGCLAKGKRVPRDPQRFRLQFE
eukprot:4198562-Amphidinium_carterae.1